MEHLRYPSAMVKYKYHCTLAKMTGIPLKTLKHYEQGTKSLSKANVSYVLSLARMLGCKPEDLID